MRLFHPEFSKTFVINSFHFHPLIFLLLTRLRENFIAFYMCKKIFGKQIACILNIYLKWVEFCSIIILFMIHFTFSFPLCFFFIENLVDFFYFCAYTCVSRRNWDLTQKIPIILLLPKLITNWNTNWDLTLIFRLVYRWLKSTQKNVCWQLMWCSLSIPISIFSFICQ